MDYATILRAQIEGIEWIVLLIIVAVLLLFGPQKLPELAKGFGRAMGMFKKGRAEVEREIREEMNRPIEHILTPAKDDEKAQ